MAQEASMAQQVKVNTKDQLRPAFSKQVTKMFIQRMGRNEGIVQEFMNNLDAREMITGALLDAVYDRLFAPDAS